MRPDHSFISQPIRSLQTMLRVLAEDDERHLSVIPDGIYGPETQSAVTRFQQLHGIPITGVTDQATWEAIVLSHDDALIRVHSAWPLEIHLEPGQIIQKGQRDPNLFLVQAMLAVLGQVYSSIAVPSLTGILDELTEDALASFQQLNRLPVTGELDKKTWKHLVLHYPLAARRYPGNPGNILPFY